MIRTSVAYAYIFCLSFLASQASASAQYFYSTPIVTSVSGVAPDAAGNVAFGCPLSPFNAGNNMAVTQMDNACALHYAGPLETAAQAASDISAAIAPYETTAAHTASLATYLTAASAAATYQPIGSAYSFTIGAPNARTVALSTAYQASNTVKPAIVNVNLTSTATISLTAGATNTATVVIGSTSAVASGTGTAICSYSNSNTGTLTIGLNLSTVAAAPCSFMLPIGWYWAVRQTSGAVTVTSAFDQSLG